MRSATQALQHRADARMLVVEDGKIEHRSFAELPRLLGPGDLLVVNDAATVPASFHGHHGASGEPIELRLAGAQSAPRLWRAVLFGKGDWRTPTELRPVPPLARLGDVFELREGLLARVVGLSKVSPRLLEIEFFGPTEGLWSRLYRAGAPVQYSHMRNPLAVWDQQTVFAGKPMAVEPPSAAFPFSWGLVLELERRGVKFARLSHAAGLSSTGDARIDRLLPLPERYEIPDATARAVNLALASGGRVIAVGTSVVRALESARGPYFVKAGAGETRLKITGAYRRRVVSGILSGMHEKGASHLDLLASFTCPSVLGQAYKEAESRGYLWHEYGDSTLIHRPLESEFASSCRGNGYRIGSIFR